MHAWTPEGGGRAVRVSRSHQRGEFWCVFGRAAPQFCCCRRCTFLLLREHRFALRQRATHGRHTSGLLRGGRPSCARARRGQQSGICGRFSARRRPQFGRGYLHIFFDARVGFCVPPARHTRPTFTRASSRGRTSQAEQPAAPRGPRCGAFSVRRECCVIAAFGVRFFFGRVTEASAAASVCHTRRHHACAHSFMFVDGPAERACRQDQGVGRADGAHARVRVRPCSVCRISARSLSAISFSFVYSLH